MRILWIKNGNMDWLDIIMEFNESLDLLWILRIYFELELEYID